MCGRAHPPIAAAASELEQLVRQALTLGCGAGLRIAAGPNSWSWAAGRPCYGATLASLLGKAFQEDRESTVGAETSEYASEYASEAAANRSP